MNATAVNHSRIFKHLLKVSNTVMKSNEMPTKY